MIYLKSTQHHYTRILKSLRSNVKLAQSGRYQSESQDIPGSIPTGGTFILKFFCSSLCKQYKNANVANFLYYGKTQLISENRSIVVSVLYLSGQILSEVLKIMRNLSWNS